MSKSNSILISWVAYNNDPYERVRGTDLEYRKDKDGKHIKGPTLTFLFDQESPYRGEVDRVILLGRDESQSRLCVDETFNAIRENCSRSDIPSIELEARYWKGTNPTDHREIFEFIRETVTEIRKSHSGKKLLVHTSPGTPAMQTVWVLMGETGFIDEPFELLKSLRPGQRPNGRAVESINLGIDTFYKRYRQSRPAEASSPDERVLWDPRQFKSESLKRLFESARRVAGLRVPVLILGERGTGKTTLANWIRFNSPFRREELDDGWPAVACGQYQTSTMRAELFGYKKGAFTDAKQDTSGLLARADGDTLFLDEVGDLAPDMQRLLIKALEERKFQPLGASQWETSTFRLLTATNVPLRKLRERLDADFFDRIALIQLRTPPLREIPEDIPWLWRDIFHRVLHKSGVDFGLSVSLHATVTKFLQTRALPGNLRDLYAVAWRIVARWNGEELPSDEEMLRWLPEAMNIYEKSTAKEDLPRLVARRFSASEPLDDLFSLEEPLPTKLVKQGLQSWMAREVRRFAKARNLSPGELTDVTAKTLRKWVKESGGH